MSLLKTILAVFVLATTPVYAVVDDNYSDDTTDEMGPAAFTWPKVCGQHPWATPSLWLKR